MTVTDDIDLAELRAHAWRLSPDTMAQRFEGESYQRAPHVRLLARKYREAVLKPNGRLIVTLPPRHVKSTTISLYGTTWAIGLKPDIKVLFCSYGGKFAGEWGRAVRNTITEHGEELGVRVAADSKAQTMWRTTAGGGMWTAGPDSPITGRGGQVIVLDDMVKNYAEAHSVAKRERTLTFYQADAYTRREKGCSIIALGTRWHVDDILGHLIQASEDGTGDEFEVINLPAFAEEHEEWDLGNGETWVREPGDPLWPEMYDREFLEATRRTLTPYMWNALYQQHPSPPEGHVISRDWWAYWSEHPSATDIMDGHLALPAVFDERLISVDTTFKDSDGTDYVVIQAWARAGARYFLIDQVRDRMNYPAFKVALQNFAKMHRGYANKVLIEESANGPAIIAELKKKMRGLVPRRPKDSKLARAHAVSGLIEAGNVFLPADAEWQPLFVEEWATFAGDDKGHDDQVDATTMALHEFTLQKRGRVRGKTAAGRGPGGMPTMPDRRGAGGLGGVGV